MRDGGNGWSLSRNALFFGPDSGDGTVLVFWTSNHAYRDGKGNLEGQDAGTTLRLAGRTRDSPPPGR
ncbi:hypothetical protein [Streptomyces sp. YIM 98790]|uniref:hypothetical protein n=1 Tax=Streptomyces sp. YIM 98790 TaxID=2689077 RepID=UPI00140A3313|nr:hypothetical protein [Streptomyces sp. YIM 98790]